MRRDRTIAEPQAPWPKAHALCPVTSRPRWSDKTAKCAPTWSCFRGCLEGGKEQKSGLAQPKDSCFPFLPSQIELRLRSKPHPWSYLSLSPQQDLPLPLHLLCKFMWFPWICLVPCPPNCCCRRWVSKLCPTPCDPMNWSMQGFPVLHSLPEFAQTHVHCISDDIQPSHPLSLPSPPALYLSQHQGFFQRVVSSHQVAKVLELQHPFFQWTFKQDS